jgi:putative phosphoesterase
MKIGVVSDTHGRFEITQNAIHLLRERGAELILHCGDIDSPETVRLFSEIPSHFVFGNWDLRPGRLKSAIAEIGGIWHDEVGQLNIAGKRLAWVHGHVRGQRQRLETSGDFDFLFYGHSHKVEVHRAGRTLVANPGALHRAKTKTVMLVDLTTGEWETLLIDS